MRDYLKEAAASKSQEDAIRALAAVNLGVVDVKEIRHDDMTGSIEVMDGDGVWHGVKGMKWGITRDSKTLRSEAAKREGAQGPNGGTMTKVLTNKKTGESHAINPDGSPGKVVNTTNPGIKAATGEETSAARYNRLAADAKAGKASAMSDADLKFFNARTEAVAKINKLNQTDPGWLSKTSKKVLENAAEQTMQQIANGVAKKYVSGPILDRINAAQAAAGSPPVANP